MHSGIKDKPHIRLIVCVLALGTLAVYWRVMDCGFVNYDDNLYVTANPHVRAGLTWAGLKWAFQSTEASNWHPLTWISLMLDCQLFGAKPAGLHYTNLLLHIASTLLLFEWLRRWTGTTWRSALVAGLFAWHPAHVESVAWVAERKDVLSTLFWMLTLVAYQRYKAEGPRPIFWYALALFFFLLGLLAKPMVVTLPFVLLLIDFWSRESNGSGKHPWKKLLVEKIPFFALSFVLCGVTFLVQKQNHAVEELSRMPLWDRFANASVAYAGYLGKIFWPAKLAVFYPHPGFWSTCVVVGTVIILLSITGLVVRFGRGRPWLAFGWLWFLGTLVPVIGLVQVGRQSIADRYAYISSIGLFMAVAWLLGEWAQRLRQERTAIIFAGGTLAVCMALTFVQVGYWKSSETLFKHDIDVAGYNFTACYNLGTFLTIEKPGEAVFYFDHTQVEDPFDAVALANSSAMAHFSLGVTQMDQRDFANAATNLKIAAKLQPTNADYRLALGMTLVKQGKTNEAQAELTTAAKLEPHNPKTHAQLAALFAREGSIADSLAEYREAVRLYHEALQKEPDSPLLLNKLAWLLATNPNEEIRNGTEAVLLARHGCELTQWQSATLIRTLSAACAESGEFDEAAGMASKAGQIAAASGDKEIIARNEELLELYRAKKPYREP